MTFQQILNNACARARLAARQVVKEEWVAGTERSIDIVAQAENYDHLVQIVIDARHDDHTVRNQWHSGLATDNEYWEQHYGCLYIEFVYDVVTIWRKLQDVPVSAAAVRVYAGIIGGGYEPERL